MPLIISQRVVPDQEPTKLSVLASGSLFDLEREACGQESFSLNLDVLKIVGRKSSPKVLCLHVLYAQPRVIQHSLVRIKDFPIRVHNVDRLGYGIHNPSKLHLVLPELFFRALMLDGNCRQRSDLFKYIQVLWTRTARLAIVHREGPQHLAFGGNDRRGPAGSQSVRQGQMTIIGPQRVHGDVRDDHRRGAVSGCYARTPGRANGDAVDGFDVTVRKAGCCAVP